MPISYLFKPFIQSNIKLLNFTELEKLKKLIDIPTIIRSALEGEDIMAAIRRKASK